jgi:hypothetical protein
MCRRACAGHAPGRTCARCVALPVVPGRMGSAHGENGKATTPRRLAVHSGGIQVSVHRRDIQAPRGYDITADAHACAQGDALSARLRRWRPILFRLTGFENTKLQKVPTKLKFSKNKSCSGAIDLQLSQRATYVLMNGLFGNVGRSWQNSRPSLLFTTRLTRFLANLHSKLECPPITKNVFLEITKNFRIGRI